MPTSTATSGSKMPMEACPKSIKSVRTIRDTTISKRSACSTRSGTEQDFQADADDPGRCCPAPAAVPMPGPIRTAVLARLSVCFSAALRTKRPDQQPPLPPFAVRLCRLPILRQPPQTHGRPHARLARASGSRIFKDKRSRDCARWGRSQTLAGRCPPGLPEGGE